MYFVGVIYITMKELCEKLKISRATVDRWRQEGLPFVKIGNGVRFIENDVMEWITKYKQN